MRKLSKILAVVLSVALLCGAVAVLASADTADNLTVTGTGIKQYSATTDFTDVTMSTVNDYLQGGNANATKPNRKEIFTDEATGNTYCLWTTTASELQSTNAAYLGVFNGKLGTVYKPGPDERLVDNDFIVTDFEFANLT